MLNIGYFYRTKAKLEEATEPEFFVLPQELVKRHHICAPSGMDCLRLRKLDVSAFKNEKGFELIARELGIPMPARPAKS